jgi:hypothetical protein
MCVTGADPPVIDTRTTIDGGLMTTARRPGSDEPPAGTHCEWCGADFEAPAGGDTPAEPGPHPRVAATKPDDAAAGTTHCEWCGAEYPVPGESG